MKVKGMARKRPLKARKEASEEAMEAESGSRSSKKRKQDVVKEVKCVPPSADGHHSTGILRSLRDVPPAHYTIKIESFSSFQKCTRIEYGNYESEVFEAGGYKWKLSLYPNGKKDRNVNGHISLYLAIVEAETLPLGWEVSVNFKLFVYDHIRDKYLTIQDAEGGVRRFHRMKIEWGFDQLLSLRAFNDASNGYLLDDCCVFGAEVFVIKPNGIGECVSMMKDPVKNTYTWKIDKFSAMVKDWFSSEEFIAGEHKWKLNLYPKGNGTAEGKTMSLFLQIADCKTLPSGRKLYAEYKLRIRDQLHGKLLEKEVLGHWFCASSDDWGYEDFLSLKDLSDVSKGFKVNDTVIVEAQIMLVSTS